MTDIIPIKRALISVSDKSGIDIFAQHLHELGIEIISTGNTAKLLKEKGIPVVNVSDYTGFPEMMGGRLKTLHPRIHGGILARRDLDEKDMQNHDIQGIDLVVINLYPFQQTIAAPDCELIQAIEQIDIGGPAMIRAAAKNYMFVNVLVDPADYAGFAKELQRSQAHTTKETRFRLAAKAFTHTASYDMAIANYLNEQPVKDDHGEDNHPKFPQVLLQEHHLVQILRYGENPHQQAAFYRDLECTGSNIAACTQHQGKALSYNNIADADTALQAVMSFTQDPACVIVKHANPCGAAVGTHIVQAYEAAYRCDPESAFGGIIALNRSLDKEMAETIIARQFVEVIIAPHVEVDALHVFAGKPNIRILTVPFELYTLTGHQLHSVSGGLLVQDSDNGVVDTADLKVVSKREPSGDELRDLLFAWKIIKFIKSNAIVAVKDRATIGIGAGQTSRVYSTRIAAIKAADRQLDTQGCVLASDAFFPFRDGIDTAAQMGVRAVIQPGGSIRDEEVIKAADEHDIAMIFTGMRHFRH